MESVQPWGARRVHGVRLRTVIIVLAVVAAITAAVACVAETSPAIPPEATAVETLKVVTTVSPITSIVENIGGTRITLQGIVPEGVNSHTFEPAPSIAAILADADLVFLNGLFLEEPTLELARATQKPGSMIVSLGDQITSKDEWQFDFSFPEENGQPNPHLWPDPILALKYAEVVRDTMSERDPDNADYYSENYDKFAGRIADLDAAIVAIIATVPSGNRKLLTYHDSWAYFARRYGMTVIGAMRPSNFSEPSAREVADLIQQIESEGIPAVFGSEVFDSDVMETIAAESGAAYVDELSDDDLPGAPGDPRHSYLGLVVNNLEIMVPALGGDASALANIDVSLVFDGPSAAVYPQ